MKMFITNNHVFNLHMSIWSTSPEFTLKSMYVKGSLMCINTNGKGYADSFQFKFRNPLFRLYLYAIRNLELFIFNKKIDAEIVLKIREDFFTVSDFSKSRTIYPEGEEITTYIFDSTYALVENKNYNIKLYAIILGDFGKLDIMKVPLAEVNDKCLAVREFKLPMSLSKKLNKTLRRRNLSTRT